MSRNGFSEMLKKIVTILTPEDFLVKVNKSLTLFCAGIDNTMKFKNLIFSLIFFFYHLIHVCHAFAKLVFSQILQLK